MNYESALEYIHAVQWAGHKPGLSRTRTLLAALGDPHKRLRFVHVAGTNGKGSTAAMLASCLQAAGYRVGLYTSPFINRFNERIQVNGEQIPDDALVRLVESRGKYMVACYFVPMEYYDSSYTYGAVIFPKDYGIKHGLVSDYLRVAEENGVVVINIVAIKGITEPNGYGFNFGITNIYESNLSRTFTFIFYAKDADGNIAYAVPQFADYSSLQAGEMTTEELIQKAEQANDVQSSFRSIVLKLQELIDSVWIYVVIAFSSVVAVWGAYIGIRVTVAKKNEEKINARGMVKQLAVGIIVMFVLAMGTPLVINGLSHWVTW